jgi:large subunit ribosomal protein L29
MRSEDRLKKMRDMSVEELEREGVEMREQIFHLRFQWAMGQSEALKKIRDLRKDQARIQTVLRERAKER